MNKSKIVMFGKYETSFPGGIEKVCKQLIEAFKRRGTTYEFVYISKANENWKRAHLGFKTTFVIMGQSISISYILYFLRTIIKNKQFIFHLHFPNINLMLTLPFLIFLNRKVVVHWHSDVILKKHFSTKLLNSAIVFFLSRTKIVCTSPEYTRQSHLMKSNVSSIPLEYSLTKKIKKTIHKLDPFSKIKFVTIGRLVEYKGHINLIERLSHLDIKWSLKIIGNGPLYKRLNNEIIDLGFEDNVKIITTASDKDKEMHLKNSNIFIFNSQTRAEAFGIALLEALEIQIPIIYNPVDYSGINYIMGFGEYGYAITQEANIECILNKMFENNEELNCKVGLGYKSLLRFDKKIIQKNWAELYETL